MSPLAKIMSESTNGSAGRSASCRACMACLQWASARATQARQFALRPQRSYPSLIPTLRLRDKRLEGLVKNLFRPSYGGNRNYTLMYTLGGLMVSADDDMRPYALIEHSTESLLIADRGRRRQRHQRFNQVVAVPG